MFDASVFHIMSRKRGETSGLLVSETRDLASLRCNLLLDNNLSIFICGSLARKKIPGGVNRRGFCFWLALLAGARLRLGTLAGGLRFFFFLAQKDSGFGSIELGRGQHGTRS